MGRNNMEDIETCGAETLSQYIDQIIKRVDNLPEHGNECHKKSEAYTTPDYSLQLMKSGFINELHDLKDFLLSYVSKDNPAHG
jgi:hypothetical protein